MRFPRTGPARLGAALLVVLVLAAAAGCSDAEEAGERPRAKPAPARPLPAAFYEDPDRDLIPTAVEQRMGTDPLADDCVVELDCPGPAAAAGAADLERDHNVLLMLDSSGSMAGPAGAGKTKIEAAKDALRRYVTATPDSFDLGFLVYGHEGSDRAEDKQESCRSAEVLDPLGELDHRGVRKTLDRFEPRGYTPVAGALREARKAFSVRGGAHNRIILVSDGVETCGGDPVAAARALKRAGIRVTVDVVGFDIGKQADAERLREIAEVTGGDYADAKTGADLSDYFDRHRERLYAYTDQLICLLGKQNDLYSCQLSKANDAYGSLLPSSDVYADELRGNEVDRIRERMRDRLEARRETARERLESLRDRIATEREEAERRLNREQREFGSTSAPPRRLYARSACPGLLPPRPRRLLWSPRAATVPDAP